jgi:hypothetical protein
MKGGLVWSHRTKRSRAAKSAQTAVPPIQDGAGSLNNKPTRGWHDTLDKKGIISNSLRAFIAWHLVGLWNASEPLVAEDQVRAGDRSILSRTVSPTAGSRSGPTYC